MQSLELGMQLTQSQRKWRRELDMQPTQKQSKLTSYVGIQLTLN